MESLQSVIELVRHEEKLQEPEGACRAREDAMRLLFEIYNGDGSKFLPWLAATDDIPADKLVFAIAVIIRTHKWKELPIPAEIHITARRIAGLDRERLIAGHYTPPPKRWPPPGYAHMVSGGLERMMLKDAHRLIGSGLDPECLPQSPA